MTSGKTGDLLDGVSRETRVRLEIYEKLLRQWQQKTNLISPSTLDDFWRRHILDSLQCLILKPNCMRWVDIGSGGGFPGLVIAIALAEKPGASVVLVESNNKKCAFLRSVIHHTGAPAIVVARRAENYIGGNDGPDIVTARALTALPGLFSLCEPWLSSKTIGLFHKGRDYRKELTESHDKWQFDLLVHKSRTSSDSVILEVKKLHRAI